MTKKDRTTLKAFFRDGALPTAEHYRDLIDSGVNQIDDGYSKTATDGLRLTSVGGSERLLSLFESLSAEYPAWVIDHGQEDSSLHFRRGGTLSDGPGVSFSPEGRLGVHTAAPDWHLDVNGTARMRGRIGFETEKYPQVPADGKWHTIIDDLTGCHAFEIMAGAGGTRGKGRYSMLNAVAMNAYNPRNWILNKLFGRRKIKAQTSVYGSYADRIRLRWVAEKGPHSYRLEMRTNANFGKDKTIRYYVTRLWFDPIMEGSRGGPARDDDLI